MSLNIPLSMSSGVCFYLNVVVQTSISYTFIRNNTYQFAWKPAVNHKHYVCVVDVLHHATVMEGGRMRRMRNDDAFGIAAADWTELSRREWCWNPAAYRQTGEHSMLRSDRHNPHPGLQSGFWGIETAQRHGRWPLDVFTTCKDIYFLNI